MKPDLTVKEFLNQKRMMEAKIERATSMAMFEFREATGLSPNFVRVDLTRTSTVGEEYDTFFVHSIETAIDMRSNP